MTEHLHAWSPIPGECGQYSCSDCPATGYRASSGEIREHKQKLPRRKQWTVMDRTHGAGGRVPPLPTDSDSGRNSQ